MTEGETNDSLLSSITRGASLYFLGNIITNAFGFLFHLILSRGLGAELYGIYAYGQTVITFILKFTNLGSDKSIIKYLPEYYDKSGKQEFILAIALITSVGSAIIVSLILFTFAPTISNITLSNSLFTSVLRLFALLIIFDTIAKLIFNTFRALEKLEYEVLSHRILKPTFRLVAAALAVGVGLSILGVMVGLVIASLLTTVISIYFLLTRFKLQPSLPSEYTTRENIYEYYQFSVPLTIKDAGDILLKRVDILMVGLFLSSAAVGIYNIALLLGGLLTIPLSAFNQLFPPIASRLYSNNKLKKLNSVYNTITRWIFTFTVIMAIGLIAYRKEILSIFGEEYTIGTTVLVIFTISQIINCAGGGNGYLLMVTNHQYILVVNQLLFGIMNIILNYIFILRYGLIGAAIATAGILAMLNIVKTVELWYFEKLFPYSIDYLKPISAGLLTLVVMMGISHVLSGITLIIVGGSIGTSIYILSLYILGINEEDREFFNEFIVENIAS